MSQFETFTVGTKIQENHIRLQRIKRTITKIKSNSEEVEVKVLQRVNRVALLNVQLGHTSEYTISLGNDYYAKVKAKTAIQILENRVKFIQDQNERWISLKNNMMKKGEKSKLTQFSQQGRNIEVIGQNQDGQQIFNIVQFQPFSGQPKARKQTLNQIKQDQQENIQGENNLKQNQKSIQQSLQNQQNQSKIQHHSQQLSEQVKPKKVSKFKAERIKMKQK